MMNNLKIILVLLGFIITTGLYAQDCIVSSEMYGGDTLENYHPLGLFIATKVIEENDGNVMFTSSYSSNGDLTENNGLLDLWIYKSDFNGNVVWSKSYGGSAHDILGPILKTTDNGYLISASTESIDGDIVNGGSIGKTWVLKLNSVGDTLWTKTFGFQNSSLAPTDLIVEPNGSYTFISFGGPSSQSMYMFNLNNSGVLQWSEFIGNNNNQVPNTLIKSEDNGYYFLNYNFNSNSDIEISKLDSLRNEEWSVSYGGTRREVLQETIIMDNKLIISGYSNSNDGDIENGNNGPNNTIDAFILIVDANDGSLLSFKNYGSSGNDRFWDIQALPNGNFLAAGSAGAANGDVSSIYGSSDAWLVLFNQDNEIIWEKTYGGTQGDIFYDLYLNEAGNILLYASTYSNDFDAIDNPDTLYNQMWLLELDLMMDSIILNPNNELEVLRTSETYQWINCETNTFIQGANQKTYNPLETGNYAAIVERNNCVDTTNCLSFTISGIQQSLLEKIQVYPNPAKDKIYFQNDSDAAFEISILDIYGKVITNFTCKIGNTELNIENFSSGMYFITSQENNKVNNIKIFINR
jgi:hypothetical protein